MNFKAYYTKLSRQQKHALAVECKTSNAFLSQIAHGHRRCGESLAIQIEKNTRRLVSCEDLRPDVDWGYLRSTASDAANDDFPEAETA